MTEGIMSWKVQLHVVSNNAMRGQQALLLLRRVMGGRVCVCVCVCVGGGGWGG